MKEGRKGGRKEGREGREEGRKERRRGKEEGRRGGGGGREGGGGGGGEGGRKEVRERYYSARLSGSLEALKLLFSTQWKFSS